MSRKIYDIIALLVEVEGPNIVKVLLTLKISLGEHAKVSSLWVKIRHSPYHGVIMGNSSDSAKPTASV